MLNVNPNIVGVRKCLVQILLPLIFPFILLGYDESQFRYSGISNIGLFGQFSQHRSMRNQISPLSWRLLGNVYSLGLSARKMEDKSELVLIC